MSVVAGPEVRDYGGWLPPRFLALAIAAMLGLHLLLPGPVLLAGAGRLVGAVPVAAALWLLIGSAGRFARLGTAIRSDGEPSLLVAEGAFRFSRNPMYLGMLVLVAGLALALGTTTPWLVLPAFWALLRFRFVAYEERMLAARFPEDWEAYRRRVRRWL
ncbi:MAG: isoprenylcysteine carboxylmethyltransferase family protein [Pseudomonadales bacterium]|nr:isoprenylcysteine carboxylmethyltransferase family protein [Pseudomonadales bacterium]